MRTGTISIFITLYPQSWYHRTWLGSKKIIVKDLSATFYHFVLSLFPNEIKNLNDLNHCFVLGRLLYGRKNRFRLLTKGEVRRWGKGKGGEGVIWLNWKYIVVRALRLHLWFLCYGEISNMLSMIQVIVSILPCLGETFTLKHYWAADQLLFEVVGILVLSAVARR